MPNEDDPEYEVWKPVIGKEMAGSPGKTILVAPSVGAYILLKYLTDEGTSIPLPGSLSRHPFPAAIIIGTSKGLAYRRISRKRFLAAPKCSCTAVETTILFP